MEGIVIVDKGLEEIANKEILEKIKSKGTSDETTVKFKIKKEEELCKLAYTAQSIKRVLLLIKEFKIEPNLDKTIEIFKSKIKKTQLKKIIDKKICIECERIGEHDFNSTDATKEVGKILADFGFKISRKEFDIQLFLYINQKKAYFCIDFSGRDLSKRNYRIFTKPGSLKGTLGYAVVRMSGYKPGETIVDPLCESGIICIETALMALRKRGI